MCVCVWLCVRVFKGRGGGVRESRANQAQEAVKVELQRGLGSPLVPRLYPACLPLCGYLPVYHFSLPICLSSSRYRVRSSRHFCFRGRQLWVNDNGTMLTLLTSMYLVVRAVSSQVSWKHHSRLIAGPPRGPGWPAVLERTIADAFKGCRTWRLFSSHTKLVTTPLR